jgi:pimeloyl-ACP methyl ester carboxylesterase
MPDAAAGLRLPLIGMPFGEGGINAMAKQVAGLGVHLACLLSALPSAAPAPAGEPKQAPLPGFTSHTAAVNGVTLHYVTGGRGEAVVLLHGWPQSWREWEPVMPALAEKFAVIAPDLRGLGDSSVPDTGYDAKTVADDVRILCRVLGHKRVAVVAHDIGVGPAYAWAAGHPAEVAKLVVAESLLPGIGEPPQATLGGEPLWHPAFHMVPDLPEKLIAGRERDYLTWFFEKFAHKPGAVPKQEIDAAVAAYSRPGRLSAGFAHYRAMPASAKQNAELAKVKLKMPVLAVGGDRCLGKLLGEQMELVAGDVTTAVLKDCGHWITAERPKEFTALLLDFLAKPPGGK